MLYAPISPLSTGRAHRPVASGAHCNRSCRLILEPRASSLEIGPRLGARWQYPLAWIWPADGCIIDQRVPSADTADQPAGPAQCPRAPPDVKRAILCLLIPIGFRSLLIAASGSRKGGIHMLTPCGSTRLIPRPNLCAFVYLCIRVRHLRPARTGHWGAH